MRFRRRSTSEWKRESSDRSKSVRETNFQIVQRTSDSIATAAGTAMSGIIGSATALGAGAGGAVSTGAGIVLASAAAVGIEAVKDRVSRRGGAGAPARSFQEVVTEFLVVRWQIRSLMHDVATLLTSVQNSDTRIGRVVEASNSDDVAVAMDALERRFFQLEGVTDKEMRDVAMGISYSVVNDLGLRGDDLDAFVDEAAELLEEELSEAP